VKVFEPSRSGLLTRSDIADVLTALYLSRPRDGESGAGYAAALLAVGVAVGLKVRIDDVSRVVVEVQRD
jgi:hypothetical protein